MNPSTHHFTMSENQIPNPELFQEFLPTISCPVGGCDDKVFYKADIIQHLQDRHGSSLRPVQRRGKLPHKRLVEQPVVSVSPKVGRRPAKLPRRERPPKTKPRQLMIKHDIPASPINTDTVPASTSDRLVAQLPLNGSSSSQNGAYCGPVLHRGDTQQSQASQYLPGLLSFQTHSSDIGQLDQLPLALQGFPEYPNVEQQSPYGQPHSDAPAPDFTPTPAGLPSNTQAYTWDEMPNIPGFNILPENSQLVNSSNMLPMQNIPGFNTLPENTPMVNPSTLVPMQGVPAFNTLPWTLTAMNPFGWNSMMSPNPSGFNVFPANPQSFGWNQMVNVCGLPMGNQTMNSGMYPIQNNPYFNTLQWNQQPMNYLTWNPMMNVNMHDFVSVPGSQAAMGYSGWNPMMNTTPSIHSFNNSPLGNQQMMNMMQTSADDVLLTPSELLAFEQDLASRYHTLGLLGPAVRANVLSDNTPFQAYSS